MISKGIAPRDADDAVCAAAERKDEPLLKMLMLNNRVDAVKRQALLSCGPADVDGARRVQTRIQVNGDGWRRV